MNYTMPRGGQLRARARDDAHSHPQLHIPYCRARPDRVQIDTCRQDPAQIDSDHNKCTWGKKALRYCGRAVCNAFALACACACSFVFAFAFAFAFAFPFALAFAVALASGESPSNLCSHSGDSA
eukprot:gene12526-biopygen9921